MDTTSTFVARAVNSTTNLNWVFLVYWVMTYFSGILLVFYLNRIVGLVVSFLARIILWKRYRVRLQVQSFKVSFLGGRILVKNLLVITENQLVLVHQGNLTWRYWLYQVRKPRVLCVDDKEAQWNASLPTRYTLEITGLEEFIFNRTQAYDEIVRKLSGEDRKNKPKSEASKSEASSEETSIQSEQAAEEDPMPSTPLDFLPLSVKINRGSVILGNESTPSLLINYYTKLRGTIDVEPAACTADHFRRSFDVQAATWEMHMKTNVSYQDPEELAEVVMRRRSRMSRFWHWLSTRRNAATESQEEADPEKSQWMGLERYLTRRPMADREEARKEPEEYARYTNIFESENAELCYYWDVRGASVNTADPAPETGIHVRLSGTTIHYGPWTDRQRGPLQTLLFPPICRDSEPAGPVKLGALREYAEFKMDIRFADETILQIPHREPSKDPNMLAGAEVRPFGWIELKVCEGSSIDVSTSYTASAEHGFDNTLQIYLNHPELSTSVNHNVLLQATSHSIDASIGYPLAWNGEAVWTFNQRTEDLQMYILREHVALMTDLFSDWSSGDPVPYELFRPFRYTISWTATNYALYLNVNEGNIVDDPLDHGNNVYFSFKGDELALALDIPMESVYRKYTEITYTLKTDQFVLALEAPPWSTVSNFMDAPQIGKTFDFVISGSYTYYTELEIDSVDTVIIDCTCADTTLEMYGFFIKYFLELKENYFGDHIHFRTLAEFTSDTTHKQEDQPAPVKVENELDIFFSFAVTNGCMVLPVHMYDCGSYMGIHLDTLEVDIRFNDYYMDIQADFSPARIQYIEFAGHADIFGETRLQKPFKPDVEIDGLAIHGHRLFGFTAEKLTYFARWAFDCGAVSIDSDVDFLAALSQSLACIKFGYKDSENSLQIPPPPIMDILNLKFVTPSVKLKLNGSADFVFDVELGKINVEITDQPTPEYSSRIDLDIDSILVSSYKSAKQVLSIATSLHFTDFDKKRRSAQKTQGQYTHVRSNDAPFHRLPFILPQEYRTREYRNAYMTVVPSLSLPNLPEPYLPQTMDILIKEYPAELKERLTAAYSEADSSMVSKEAETPSTADSSSADPQCAYDSLIVDMQPIEIFASPEAFTALSDIFVGSLNFSLYRVADSVQIDVFDYLQQTRLPSCVRLKFVTPSVAVRIADSPYSEDHLDFNTGTIGVSLSNTKTSDSEDAASTLEVNATFSDLTCRMFHGSDPSLSVSLYHLALKHSDSPTAGLTRVEMGDIAVSFAPEDTQWMFGFVEPIATKASAFADQLATVSQNRQKAKMEFVYQISTAGVNYKITHDPPCITKPSYVTRFTDNHTRLQNSWRIMMRIRHVMQNLPEAWHEHENALFKAKRCEVGENGLDEVLDIFQNWRQWESRNIADSYIFRHVFPQPKAAEADKTVGVEVLLRHFEVGFNYIPKLLLINDIHADVNMDFVDESLLETLQQLTSEQITRGVDVTVKVGSFESWVDDLKRASPQIVSLVSSIRQRMKEAEKSPQPSKPSNLSPPSPPSITTLHLSVPHFETSLGIERTRVSCFGTNGAATACILSADELLGFTFQLDFDAFSVSLLSGDTRLLSSKLDSHTVTLTSLGDLASGKRTVTISSNQVSLVSLPGTAGLADAMDYFMEYEYDTIRSLMESVADVAQQDVAEQPKSDSVPFEIPGQTSVLMSCSKLLFRFEIFSPITYMVTCDGVQCSLEAGKQGVTNSFGFARVHTRILSNHYEYAQCIVDKGRNTVAVRAQDDGKFDVFAKFAIGTGRIQLLRNDLVQSILQGFQDAKTVKANFLLLDAKLNQLLMLAKREEGSPPPPSTTASPTLASRLLGSVRAYVSLNCDTLGVVGRVNRNQVILDSSNVCWKANSFDPVLGRSRPTGSFSFPSTKLTLISNTPRVGGRFTIFDINMTLAMSTPKDSTSQLPQLTLTSDFCRVVLNPHYAIKLIEMYGEVMKALSSVRTPSKSVTTPTVSAVPSDALQTVLSFFAISVVSKNFCVGWLFSATDDYYLLQLSPTPGIIFGFENSQFTCPKGAGKMSFYGLYVSLANGNTPADFYSTHSEVDSDNRAYFPEFNLVYTIEHKDVRAKVNGDVVDFKLQTPAFLIVEPLGRSIMAVQSKLSELKKVIPTSAEVPSAASSSETASPLQFLGVQSFRCVLKFDGAEFLVTNPNVVAVEDQSQTLHLKAPKVTTVLTWTHTTKHSISLLTVVSRTDNRLVYSCVPVLSKLKETFQNLMRSNSSSSSNNATTNNITTTTTPIQWSKILKDVSFDFALEIAPQRLLLTCEPRASVAAEVSTEGIGAMVTSDGGDFSALLFLKNLRAELRHAYSKEASAYLSVDNLMVNANVTAVDGGPQFSVVGRVDEVGALINVQQRQDLDAFMDLWMPSKLYEMEPETTAETDSQKRTFAALLREVSTTSAFPWTFLLIIKRISMQLDLGASLGVLTGSINNTWAVSKKAKNWDQNVRFQSESLVIESEGRLGGVLRVEQARMASVISWLRDGAPLSVPLVMLSVGIKAVEAKVSLDFHPFLILEAQKLAMSVYNERSRGQADKLCGRISLESLKVFQTALAASNFVDIYTIGLRIRQDIEVSYRQVWNEKTEEDLLDSSDEEPRERSPKPRVSSSSKQTVSKAFLGVIRGLGTELDVVVGSIQIMVFPSSLTGSQALVVKGGRLNANFAQSSTSKVEDKLSLRMSNVLVALSSLRKRPTEKSLETVGDYVSIASKASGGSIIVLPSLGISMDVWQQPDSNVVRYTYDMRFDDKVDIRWNIGSVYFIRQMWYSHANALQSRLKALRIFTMDELGDNFEENYKESLLESVNVEDRLNDVEQDKKYVYVAVSEPHIETPQLRDLGNATPPLEWFGLHRTKFPNLTHQMVILSLQKMIKEVEQTYSRVLH